VLKGEGEKMENTMKSKNRIMTMLLMLALILTSFIGTQVGSVDPVPDVVELDVGVWEKYGPRVDKLTFKIAGSVSAETLMLANGEIDIMDWATPGTEWTSWLADPEITMGRFLELSMIYFAPNHARWPLGHGDQKPAGLDWNHFGGEVAYTGTHSLSDWPDNLEGSAVSTGGIADTYFFDPNCQRCQDARQYRRALAHLVDRDPIIANMKGAGWPMQTLIMPSIVGAWENTSAKMDTMYPYSISAAQAALAVGGFGDYDEDGYYEYSPGHLADPAGPTGPVDMEELPVIDVYIRQDDPERIFAGVFFTQQMELAGIPNNPIITSNVICSQKVWQYPYDYDMYIEYWDWGVPMPDILYEGFHTEKDYYPVSWADNSVRFHNRKYDVQALAFKYAWTPTAAEASCDAMQGIMSEQAAVIPIYTHTGYMGRRTNYGTFPGEGDYQGKRWNGSNNEQGLGWSSLWNMLNMHPEGLERGGTLRHGLVNDVTDWNLQTTWWFYDLQVLLQIYEGLIVVNPENMTQYIPWLAESHNVTTWWNGTALCSAVNFTLVPNILWQDGEFFGADDVEYSYDLTRDFVTMYYWATKDYNDSVIYYDPVEKKETIEIRFNLRSWLAESWASGVPIVPKHIWKPALEGAPYYGDPAGWDPGAKYVDAVIGTGPFRFFGDDVLGRVDRVIGQYVYLEQNPTYFRRLVRPDFYPNTVDWDTTWTSDGKVDILDFQYAITQFGLDPGTWHSLWGPLADVNKDRKVRALDIAEVGVRFGQTGFDDGWPYYYK